MDNNVISRIQQIVPIYPGTADPDTPLPYATYAESSEPIVTFDGIAGYDDSFSVAIFANSKILAERLRDKVIEALHGASFGDISLYYQGSEYIDYADLNISSFELTFSVLK